MKKKAVLFLVLTLIWGTACLAFADEYATVTNGRLNLRQYATSSSPSLGQYKGGTWIRIIGAPTNGWYPVITPDGKNGYMYGTYLTFASNRSYGIVRYAQGGYVNLRSGPSLSYPVITQVTSGTSVSILDDSYEWNYVSVMVYGNSYQGYMHDSLISRSSETAVVITRNGGKVNVCSGPSFGYGSIGSLSSGTTVNVILKGTDWYWISGGGLTGFMSTSYLSGTGKSAGNTVTTPTTSSTTAYVNNPRSTQILNLRAAASQSSRSLGQYKNGTKVKVVYKGSTWCEVYVGTKHGYMMTRYLSFNGKYLPATTVAPAYSSTQSVQNYQLPTITATPVPVYQQATVAATPVPVYQSVAATTAPVQSGSGTASNVKEIKLTGSGEIRVYNDSAMSTLKTTYSAGKTGKLLSYGEKVCLVLIDNSVGYVSTSNISY
ncbi:MAG: SH3 domain-containing protein [Clostridia bacterium]|nr:SH3 domain-containing protein [Clostridia bacterium]